MAEKQTINYLKLYRKKCGLSQKDLACLMGFKSTTAISNYERGNQCPSLVNLLKLEIISRTPVAFLYRNQYHSLKTEIRKKEIKLNQQKRIRR